jgi:hypothetical protein
VGKPHLWGLEHDETLRRPLRSRIVGEVKVEADAIELTAAGGDVIESDKGLEQLTHLFRKTLRPASAKSTPTKSISLKAGGLN